MTCWQRRIWIAVVLALCAPFVGRGLQAQDGTETLRGEFRQLVFAGRTVGDLSPRLVGAKQFGQLLEERVRITTEAGHEAVAVLLRDGKPGRRPTVVVQHFLGGHKDEQTVRTVMESLARQGYLVAAIDGRYRGERANGTTLHQAIAEALRTGKGRPWLLDTAYDVIRTLEFLVTRPEVDAERIAILGISEGGMIAWMAGVCEPRFRVVIPMISVCRFNDVVNLPAEAADQAGLELLRPGLEVFARQLGEPEVNARVWRIAWERLLPSCCDKFESTRLIPLIAPRPLLILNHEKDELIPLAGAQAVFETTRDRYRQLGAEDRLQFRVAPGLRHRATDLTEIILINQWLQRWLR